ncbi:MAG: 16S rRNA (cytosine(1402)-N(4))-methyltransferase RsmH [Salinivirgaceae bacterium]|nr:16S rRNA (cytosine(1402)-N(4))-methyltransferase RsmH [Salinivirgaceae bacterium]MDD4747903.1 16S rRNA (cytosine(1402)-N(4))-methyltransferase RsmH [Salinivirgaceae bacterium]MDY0279759.1 16S rRNA (cytosine(1402)-N(4))-methyltransferase RsmH [Salinivirgaceae bacterium]
MVEYHVPVMLEECMEGLDVNPNGIYVDVTFGGGGHSKAILDRLDKGKLIAFDQDADAVANAPKHPNLIFVHHNFKYLRYFLRYHEIETVDGILADLGVSSHHFDDSSRGFSFRFDSNLDMRMNQSKAFTAAHLLNEYSKENITAVLRNWGEVDKAWQIAEAIIQRREQKPLKTTGDLLSVVEPIVPERFRNKSLAKIYQALRIEVNGEMDALQDLLTQSAQVLSPHGRIVIMTYHSLEDRLVKNFFRSGNFSGKLEKDFFGNIIAPFELVNRKIIVPTDEEIERNVRARSAKLRIAKRTVYGTEINTDAGV